MKIYINTDLEGVAGVTTFYVQTSPDGPGYATACRLLTQEVNAAIDGFIDGGADDFIVNDGHGPGGIVFEDIHPAAKLIHGRPVAPKSEIHRVVGDADAIAFVGQHAMAGTPGANLCHTMNSRTVERYTVNGIPVGETAMWALYYGAFNIPVIFLSGDDAACREVEQLIPSIVTATTKVGLSKNCAMSLSKEQSRALIRKQAEQALVNHRNNPVKPVVWNGPFVFEKTFLSEEHADSAEQNARLPVVRLSERTIRLTGDRIEDIIFA